MANSGHCDAKINLNNGNALFRNLDSIVGDSFHFSSNFYYEFISIIDQSCHNSLFAIHHSPFLHIIIIIRKTRSAMHIEWGDNETTLHFVEETRDRTFGGYSRGPMHICHIKHQAQLDWAINNFIPITNKWRKWIKVFVWKMISHWRFKERKPSFDFIDEDKPFFTLPIIITDMPFGPKNNSILIFTFIEMNLCF